MTKNIEHQVAHQHLISGTAPEASSFLIIAHYLYARIMLDPVPVGKGYARSCLCRMG
jgi:hypothetical protein